VTHAAFDGNVPAPLGTHLNDGKEHTYPLPAGVGICGVGTDGGVGCGGGAGVGVTTPSITCTTPLLAARSRLITVALLPTFITSDALRVTKIIGPSRVWIRCEGWSAVDKMSPKAV
jgi:hypothetical protein